MGRRRPGLVEGRESSVWCPACIPALFDLDQEWLHAYAIKSAPPDKIGFIYMLQGGWDFSNTDPFATKPEAGKATITGPHVMVVGPRMKSVPGYDRTGEGVDTAIPYVMWKDTQYEHLMIPIH